MTFRTMWAVDEAAWAEARAIRRANPPRSGYDQAHQAMYGLLDGEVQFEHDGRRLYPPSLVPEIWQRLRARHAEWNLPPRRDRCRRRGTGWARR